MNGRQALDTFTSAQHHFYKTLLKNKAVSDHPDLPPPVKSVIKLPSDAATLNVNARLCKSNQVKEALAAALGEIQHALGVEVESSASLTKRRLRTRDFEAIASGPSGVQRDSQSAQGRTSLSPVTGEVSDNAGEAADESEEDFAPFNDRIVGSSDDHSEIEELEQQLALEGVEKASRTAVGYNVEADLSISGSDAGSRSVSPEPQKAPAPKRSSFLPSLTMGGYISGSGSDIDDDIDVAPKKNRRGQRARQQIWEQKFGSKAKHLQKQGRDSGWDPKRGATDSNDRRGRERNTRNVRSGPDYKLGARLNQTVSKSDDQMKTKHRDDGGPIHPSWEAAKRAKEKKDAPVKFQGKKITFD